MPLKTPLLVILTLNPLSYQKGVALRNPTGLIRIQILNLRLLMSLMSSKLRLLHQILYLLRLNQGDLDT
jgi:hypothetical protein